MDANGSIFELMTINYMLKDFFNLSLRSRPFLEHLTVTKASNLFKIEQAIAMNRNYVSGYPYIIVFSIANDCNLRCPLCPTGSDKRAMPRVKMDFNTFKRSIDILHKHAFTALLFNFCEPLLHREVFKMIRYAELKNVGTCVSTNFNIHEEQLERILSSGLDKLVVSIDGVTQKTYSIYRKGGNIERVLSNLKLLIKKKLETRSRKPKIIWKFLVNRYNEHEITQAKRIAASLDVPILFGSMAVPLGFYDGKYDESLLREWMPIKNKKYIVDYSKTYLSEGKCTALWRSINIQYDGTIVPCCSINEEGYGFGNILHEDFQSIWNNDKYIYSRRLFTRKDKNLLREGKTICTRCREYKSLCALQVVAAP